MRYSFKKGFTLTELLVVIAIATIMITVLVIQQSKWNDSLSVNTQAYELALMIRQAQVYSLGVKEDTIGVGGDKFNIGYGVYLDQSHLNQYIFFADRNGDKKYTAGEAIETKTFTRGVTIKDVCGDTRCFPGAGPLAQAGILFFRPETKATISLLNAGGSSVDNPPIVIRLQSLGGRFSLVKVEANGQVSVSQ
jgi:prepilin-type N-terminal cleavage/methylation domain-containing protein